MTDSPWLATALSGRPGGGLQGPFVLAAIALTTASATGWSTEGLWHWVWSDILERSVVGLLVGLAVGRLLG
ncbi:hypothetical protein [Streptomyces sp. NPDC060334]|uniref:hypothetical protein n=1 Tax=Streptomyces sp. NPDC060334 TaxID=3347099 RepID=UPI0036DD2009